MKKSIFRIAAAFAMLGGGAIAADLPLRSEPPPPPSPIAPISVFSWTGFYVGSHIGYGSGESNARLTGVSAGLAPVVAAGPNVFRTNYGLKPDGLITGSQIGYNFQSGNLVYGVEADISGTQMVSSQSSALPGGGGFSPSLSSASSFMPWFATLRGRIGYASGPMLFYATAGLAAGHVRHAVRVTANPIAGGDFLGKTVDTKLGFTVGAGMEYAFAQNWSAKLEYLYYDLGRSSVTARDPLRFPADFATYRFNDRGHIVRVGVNYLFNYSAGPVMARY